MFVFWDLSEVFYFGLLKGGEIKLSERKIWPNTFKKYLDHEIKIKNSKFENAYVQKV